MAIPTHYYIWYRLRGDAAEARVAVDRVLADVFRNAGVIGRVLARRDDPRTWMEVYENVADVARFEQALALAVERHRVAAHAEGGVRHLEPFIPTA